MRAKSGFTLIELMIVIVIIGILAAIALPRFAAAANAVKEREADLILKQVYTQQLSYRERHDAFATTYEELVTTGWQVPALKYFTMPGSPEFPVCLQSNGKGDYSNRGIDENGIISVC